ncbi:peptidoglycan recognition protein family protein [Halobacillus karajensis]|uniref:peptidoglycan recognition protein family protein n=1 Tax=Halobacillus karajensis TaxID=195088 RepID=UPI00045CE001|nr:N-acetylmuramoyl-L-alanine amidase [Halobacillus karajensis]CDQ21714.1 N-acetylmuramoyl-L-alanine amidase CwlH precursor [Halobacillus karajensis]
MKTLDVSRIGDAVVTVDIVPKGNYEIRPAYYMNPKEIAVHNTGNKAKGADAEMHNRYIHNMASYSPRDTRYASWHFSVDEDSIYQHLPLDENAWHTGDGSDKGSGNRMAIGVEICENSDGDTRKAEENAIALIVYLCKRLNISVYSEVKPHQAYSGKYCPRVILGRDGGFEPFRKRIINAYEGKVETASTEKADYVVGRIKSDVWGHDEKNFKSSSRTRVLFKGQRYKVYKEVSNNMYAIGKDHYVSRKYVELEEPLYQKKEETNSGIPVKGRIKVSRLNNFTYIYSKPTSNSTRVGRAMKNQTFDIAGSVPEFYEVIHEGKRAYVRAKYCERV